MISLIVATRNRASDLTRLLASLARQTYRDFQVIVVDQSTGDARGETERAVAGATPAVACTYVTAEPGLSRARNVGLGYARGDVIAFPDDDCWYPDDLLARVAAWMDAHPTFAFVSGAYTEPDRWNPAFAAVPFEFNRRTIVRKLSSVTLFLRRAVVDRTGLRFDEQLGAGTALPGGEETDLMFSVVEHGFVGRYDPSLVVYHPIERPRRERPDVLLQRERAYGYVYGKHVRSPVVAGKLLGGVVKLAARAALDSGMRPRLRSRLSGVGLGLRARRHPARPAGATAPRVVHVTSVHPVTDTRIFQKQCRSLAASGFEVVLIAPDVTPERTLDGVAIRPIDVARTRVGRMLGGPWTCLRAALATGGDLFHFHDPELLPCAQVLRWLGRRVVFDMHENLPKALRSKSWIRPALRPPVAWSSRIVERWLLHGMPTVFAERSYVPDYPAVRRHAVVQNMPAVDELLAIREPRYDRFTAVYMGQISTGRGSLLMLSAVRHLRRDGGAIDLDCIGRVRDGATAAAFGSGGDTQGDGSRVDGLRWHGPMAPMAGWRVVARCHVGLAVLRPEPNYVGSYPTKMFEYMALGLPVVVSDFPLYRQVVEDAGCGLCVDSTDERALVDALRWLAAHPEEAEAMGQRGRAAVRERYSWAGEHRKLLELYATLGLTPPAAVPRIAEVA